MRKFMSIYLLYLISLVYTIHIVYTEAKGKGGKKKGGGDGESSDPSDADVNPPKTHKNFLVQAEIAR